MASRGAVRRGYTPRASFSPSGAASGHNPLNRCGAIKCHTLRMPYSIPSSGRLVQREGRATSPALLHLNLKKHLHTTTCRRHTGRFLCRAARPGWRKPSVCTAGLMLSITDGDSKTYSVVGRRLTLCDTGRRTCCASQAVRAACDGALSVLALNVPW